MPKKTIDIDLSIPLKTCPFSGRECGNWCQLFEPIGKRCTFQKAVEVLEGIESNSD